MEHNKCGRNEWLALGILLSLQDGVVRQCNTHLQQKIDGVTSDVPKIPDKAHENPVTQVLHPADNVDGPIKIKTPRINNCTPMVWPELQPTGLGRLIGALDR